MRSSVLRKSDYALRPLPRVLREEVDLGRPTSRSSISKLTIAALAERFAPEPPVPGNAEIRLPARETKAASPTAQVANVKGLISALVGVALIPTAILFVLLWRGMMQPHADSPLSPPVAQSAASAPVRLELLSAEGTILADSETRLDLAPAPAAAELVSAIESEAPKPMEAVSPPPKPLEAVPPAPQPKPAASATIAPSVKVAKVKTVAIKPPAPTRPHDGAYALGEAVDDPVEWMEIVSAVDMHARPQQSAETVKVVEKGHKLRVGARDKNWVEVTDPATSAHGWIYSRFLKPTEPPAQ